MPAPVFSIKIGGEAGQGVKSAGLMLAKAAARQGLYAYNYVEYPSLIRGGHNLMQVNISREPVSSTYSKCDFLIALNQDTINKHGKELGKDGEILLDADKKYDLSILNPKVNIFAVPLSKIAKEAQGVELLSNTVAVGATLGLLGGDFQVLLDLVNEEFKNKGAALQMNLAAAQTGYDFAVSTFSAKQKDVFRKSGLPGKMQMINGNEACAYGAIDAKMNFAAIYPMSPISPILAVLAQNQEKYGYIYRQPEDEISAIHMSIGASFGGARALTATSGGGFCLMTEGYGLAGMSETPLVIIEGMRGGPATGLPTWSGQGDLRMVMHAHQGEFFRIVLAAGDAREAYELTMEAFNLAEIYQTPVVVLIDKNICDNDQTFPAFNSSSYKIDHGKIFTGTNPDYQRYHIEPDGISPRSFAGSGNFFIANSDEHDETGYSTEETEMRNLQMHKRMTKLTTCSKQHMQGPKLYGPKEADLTIVSWGSNKGTILEALKNFPNVNYLHLTWMNPFPADEIKAALDSTKRTVAIEANYVSQLAGIIREQTGIAIYDQILKYDGRPFFTEEIIKAIEGRLE